MADADDHKSDGSDSADYEDLSKEELIEELLDLEKQLQEKEVELQENKETIQSLTAQNLTKNHGRRGKGKGDEAELVVQISRLESDNNALQEKLNAATQEALELKEKMADVNAQMKQVTIEKGEAEASKRLALKRVDELEAEIMSKTQKTEAVLEKNAEALKNKSHTQKMQLQLFQENEELTNQVKALEERLLAADSKERDMEEVIVSLDNEKQQLEEFKDHAELKEKEAALRFHELEKEVRTLHEKLQLATENEGQRDNERYQEEQRVNAQIAKYTEEVKAQKDEIKKLQKEVNTLRDQTLIGKKQQEIDEYALLYAEKSEVAEELGKECEILLAEKEQLITKIIAYEENIEGRIYDRIAEETEKNRMLEKKLSGLAYKLKESEDHFSSLEKEKDYLKHELEEAENWKMTYESGHGLQQLAVHQKRLKEDNRKLTITLEQCTRKLGEAMDANGILAFSFEKLKTECGKDDHFGYDKHQIQEEMLGENVRTKSQLLEVELQVDTLENECIRLRKTLKEQAGAFGAEGFKFTGLNADQLMRVNEYAMNLRDGIDEIPKEQRPIELLRENAKLKEDCKMMTLMMERYEREIGSSVGQQAQLVNSSNNNSMVVAHHNQSQSQSQSQSQHEGIAGGGHDREQAAVMSHAATMIHPGQSLVQQADLAALRDSMQQVLHENNELRQQMFSMQDELVNQFHAMQAQQQVIKASTPVGARGQQNPFAQIQQVQPPQFMQSFRAQYPPGGQVQGHRGDITPIPRQPAVSATPDSPVFASMIQQTPPVSILKQPSDGTAAAANNNGLMNQQVLNTAVKHTYIATENNMFMSPASTATASLASPSAHIHHPSTPGYHQQPDTPNFQQQQQQNNNNIMSNTLMSQRNQSFGSFAFPPDDYAEQIKETNKQLIQCLDTLQEREAELDEQRRVTAGVEQMLVSMKQQMSVVYYDFHKKVTAYDDTINALKSENLKLLNSNEDLKLTASGLESKLDMELKSLDPVSLNAKILQMSKRMVICDVNELVFSRKYTTLAEQLKQEQDHRIQLQYDIAEIESGYKKRILYLEQQKAVVGMRMTSLQSLVSNSVPQANYIALQTELENLRDDHLLLLRKDIECKIATLSAHEQDIELKQARRDLLELSVEYEKQCELSNRGNVQLQQQKELIDKYFTTAAAPGNSSARGGGGNAIEMSRIISEMAKYKGEASRLEVELIAARKQMEHLNQQTAGLVEDNNKLTARMIETEKAIEDSEIKERSARKLAMELTLKYDNGGVTKDEADVLHKRVAALQKEAEEAKLEVVKQKELADIAFLQAETISTFRKQNQEELSTLRDYCTQIESKGDDDFLIGRLQRQLLSTKNSYKAFVRKYQLLRTNMRQRELTLRVLEARLDQREEAMASIQDTHRLEINALKHAIQEMQDNAVAAAGHGGQFSADSVSSQVHGDARKLRKGSDVIRNLTKRVGELSSAADHSIGRANHLEEENKKVRGASAALKEANKELEKQVEQLQKELHKYTNKSASDKTAEALFQKLFVGDNMANNHSSNHYSGAHAHDNGSSSGGANASLVRDLKTEVESLQRSLSGLKDELGDKNRTIEDLKLQVAAALHPHKRKHEDVGDEGIVVDSTDAIFKESSYKAASEGQKLTRNQHMLMKQEQAKLQEAATATIGSLKSLLEEKNELIGKHERKISELQFELARACHSNHGVASKYSTAAGRQADALLSQIDREMGTDASPKPTNIYNSEYDADTSASASAAIHGASNGRLHKANDELFGIIQEKDIMIKQLEEKLLTEFNQRERAELRCGSSIHEMEAMKADIITLVNQLRESEARIQTLSNQAQFPHVGAGPVSARAAALSPRGAPVSKFASSKQMMDASNPKDTKKISELSATVKSKDKKMREYRDIIIKLKNEFMRQEEQRAEEQIQKERSSGGGAGSKASGGGATVEELQMLRKQVSALRDGLSQAKEEMEKHRKSREKLSIALKTSESRCQKFEDEMQNAQELAATAQQSLAHCRKERDESLKKEVRMREKLKEFLSDAEDKENSEGGNLGQQLKDFKDKVRQLEKNAEVLRIQNMALRRANANGEDMDRDRDRMDRSLTNRMDGPDETSRPVSAPHHGTGSGEESKEDYQPQRPVGRILGSTRGDDYSHDAGGDAATRELRQEKHARWEEDKKLQSRIGVLNKRVRELDEDNNALRTQLKEWKDKAAKELTSKQEVIKQHSAAMKRNTVDLDQKRVSPGDMHVVEEVSC